MHKKILRGLGDDLNKLKKLNYRQYKLNELYLTLIKMRVKKMVDVYGSRQKRKV